MAAMSRMQASMDQARRSAQIDIYSYEALSTRPLIWIADYIDLAPELEMPPLQSVNYPFESTDQIPSFEIDSSINQLRTNSLIAFKQNNESVDSQFLRGIGSLEINLVNLKTTRSPEQGLHFNLAQNAIRDFYTVQIADDWRMLDWANSKLAWLEAQESTIERGIRAQLSSLNNEEDNASAIRGMIIEQHDLASDLAQNTSWNRTDIPESSSFREYVNNLSEDELEDELFNTSKSLWYDAPYAALNSLSDTLSILLPQRVDLFQSAIDTLGQASYAFSKSLDPLYDIQTQYTTILYGMAEEYREWRSSIRGLDPEAVDYSFQFTPYRGNYRILADDLTPPDIDEILITTSNEGYLNRTELEWSSTHPVEVAETSIAISEDTTSASYFTSLAQGNSSTFSTTRTDQASEEQEVSLTLRVRGAGGVPAVKKGQFKVQVNAIDDAESVQETVPLIPFDPSAPPEPIITGLDLLFVF